MPCVGRVERPEQHRAREGGWASNESHDQPKPNTNAMAKPTESRNNRTANGSRPEGKKHIGRHWNITIPNTHTHIQRRRRRPGGPGEHRDIAASCTKRSKGRAAPAQQGAARWGAAWQAWQGSGGMLGTCWQKECCWPDALRAHSRARGCVRCTLTSCVA